MREVKDNLDLAVLQKDGRGYILNDRWDRRMIHKAGCEAVVAMVTSAYKKIFFEDGEEAVTWLQAEKENIGRDWASCGMCGGVG